MKPKSCVIVDDDNLMIQILKGVVKKDRRLELMAVYKVAHDAIFGLAKASPDILFLDINLPVLDGVDVMEVLSSKQATIIVSTDKERFVEFEGFENVVGFLEKPVRYDEYNQLVEKAVRYLENE